MIFKNKKFFFGFLIIFSMIILGILAPVIAEDPYKTDMLKRLSPPSLEHPFGTDQLGRDIFSRVIYGARVTLLVSFAVSLLSLTIGSLIGALSGYFGGVIDDILSRITDIFLSIPEIVLNIAMVGVLSVSLNLSSSIFIVILAIVITNWVTYARITRGLVLSLKESDFVLLAKSSGANDLYILLKHILPNALLPIIVLVTLNIGNVIMTISTLGFLGLGIQPPTPEWGAMLNSGKNYIMTSPWVVVFPGLAIMLAILGFNLMGDCLRDIFEPKSRRSVYG
ncbi:nickel transporter permease [Methanotorris igneus]|uniref:ABC-type transporter, integral membrane subunit n=1 Tax=Methanotorris igneus (strain DSM 5666 / JCM 11834 / Kol 5) TaxID=880724 RepID=F6BF75_METIK|nr:nickel transporter permease [Methanotorris igneus]AEF96945.1 ABC-type transporter, integral membrane subunit [Methanotorris igneus Kol 5]